MLCSAALRYSEAALCLVWSLDPSIHAHTRTRLTACASGKEGSGQTGSLSTGQGWKMRKGVRMQLPTTTYVATSFVSSWLLSKRAFMFIILTDKGYPFAQTLLFRSRMRLSECEYERV